MPDIPQHTTPSEDPQVAFSRLAAIVEELRQKCPWDRKQTKESLRHLSIEEVHELADAILEGDYEEIKNELGDVLLHILFYSSLAAEKERFSLADMINAQIEKLVRRHPHVYGDMQGATEEEIHANWEQVKAWEKQQKGKTEQRTLDGVPDSLPSLIKAYRMQEKAASVGFDWDNEQQVWDKVKEEMLEFEEAQDARHREEEMGDLLFALVNYCRHQGINPEHALALTNQKFKHRFESIERAAQQQERVISELSLEEMEAEWQKAKGE